MTTYNVRLRNVLRKHGLNYRVEAPTREQAGQAAADFATKHSGDPYVLVSTEITYLKPEITIA